MHFRRFALLSCVRFEKSIIQKCPSSKEEIKIRNCCAYSPKLRNYKLHHPSSIQILRNPILSSSCLVVEWLSLINVVLYKKKPIYSKMRPPPLQGTSSKKTLYHRNVSAKSFDRTRFTKRKLLVLWLSIINVV